MRGSMGPKRFFHFIENHFILRSGIFGANDTQASYEYKLNRCNLTSRDIRSMQSAKDIASATRIYIDYVTHRPLFKIYKRKNANPSKANENILMNGSLLFIHIPKTAGTSVRQTFRGIENKMNLLPQEPHPKLLNTSKHIKARDLRKSLSNEEYERYFKFTFVRNPWDLMVSSFFWWRQKAIRFNGLMYTSAMIRNMNFEDFIKSPYGRYFINEFHGTMSEWFEENGEDAVNYVGKVECLEKDLKEIARINEISEQNINIPELNQTQRSEYRDFYTKYTKRIVEERFADVIERFDYRF